MNISIIHHYKQDTNESYVNTAWLFCSATMNLFLGF